MKLRYVLNVIRTLRIPGFASIMKDWQALLRLHFLHAAHGSGLLAALPQPASRDELVKKLGVQRQEILDALLDVGLAIGELSCKQRTYRIAGSRSRALMGQKGDMLAAMVEANVTYYNSVYLQAAERMSGAPLAEDLGRIGRLVARFSEIGEPFLRDFLAEIVSGAGSLNVLDLGCGSGKTLKTVQELNTRASGIGIDSDQEIIASCRQNLRHWGIEVRFQALPGDILESLPEKDMPFDLICCFNLLYYFTVEERLRLLPQLRSLLSPSGKLVIAMHFHGSGRDLAAANLNMVNSSFQGLVPLPDVDEVQNELWQSGFAVQRIKRLIPRSAFCGIVAHREGSRRSG